MKKVFIFFDNEKIFIYTLCNKIVWKGRGSAQEKQVDKA